MRDEEKQIEEMAKDIYATGVAIDGTDIAYGVHDNDDHFHRMARKLYKIGYRKKSDTAKEIIEMLKAAKAVVKVYFEAYDELIENIITQYGVDLFGDSEQVEE